MSPLHTAPMEVLAAVRFVLTDVDDTLTRRGRIDSATFAAVHRLAEAGIQVIPVTGGCAGWCDHLVRAWPVAAVVGENGAFSFRLDSRGRLIRHLTRPLEQLREAQSRLLLVAEEALRRVPAARLALDQPYRLADVAVDHAQEVGPLVEEEVAVIVETFRAAGASARASSIHVNAFYGDHDKATAAERLLSEDFGLVHAEIAERVLFVGDAPNDEPMMARFPLSVGVANIRLHLPAMRHHPRWVTGTSHGGGFVELADSLLTARRAAVLR